MKEHKNTSNKKKNQNFQTFSQSNIQKFSLTKEYREKTVLVTGHTGFKGTWLSMWLSAIGARVVGYSLEPNTKPSVFEATYPESRVIHIIGDVRDEKHLQDVFQTYNPEFVFHLAAQPLVRLSYKDPKTTYETNVMGLVNLLEVIRKTSSVRVIINVTSDKVYENKEWFWGYSENDPLGGYDPYSSSKGCSELITAAYRRSFFNPNKFSEHGVALSSVRAGNAIGGGDWCEDRIIPDSIRSLVNKEPIEVRNPQAIRPWQHVLEPLSGYLWLGALMYNNGADYASTWNFGPKAYQTMTVGELVEQAIKIWGEGSWFSPKKAFSQPHEANYLNLDCSKAYHMLKWHGLMDIEETVMLTINWYKSYYTAPDDAYNLCLGQIKNYIAMAKNSNMEWIRVLDLSSS